MIIHYMNIIILRFEAMLIFQPCFSAKEHDYSKMYASDMFETIFLLCHKNNFPMIAILLLIFLCTRTCVWNVCYFYHCSNFTFHLVFTKCQCSLCKQSGILRTSYFPTWINIGIKIQGGNNYVYIDRDHGIYE